MRGPRPDRAAGQTATWCDSVGHLPRMIEAGPDCKDFLLTRAASTGVRAARPPRYNSLGHRPMHDLDLILTLTAGLATALAFGYLTNRLGLSPIVGYLLAGIAVGPNTPGFVANRELADQLAEIGVILLMFGVGLHFHFKE